MKQRIVVGLIATSLGLCAMGQRSQAQTGSFRFDPPASLIARGGSFTISWFDDDQGIDEDGTTRSVTWYYARSADGSDRKRMVTLLRDDFKGFRSNWRPIGPFALEWTLRRNRDLGREVLYGPRDGGSLISSDIVQRDVVVSALVRPLEIRNNFALGFRVGPDGRGYELRSEGNKLLVSQPSEGALAERQIFEVRPQSWYWYEVGLRSVRKKDLKIRVRVYDAERKRVLATINDVLCRPLRRDKDFLEAGMLALTGPADFGELYVDPWKARWCDDSENQFQWNTAEVPDGEYYLIAEICDGRTITTQRSNYRVRVVNRGSVDE